MSILLRNRVPTMQKQMQIRKHEAQKSKRIVSRDTLVLCESCHENFFATCSRAKYCSKKCKSKADSRKRTRKEEVRCCVVCGDPFTARSDTKTLHCGFQCGGKTAYYSTSVVPGGGKLDGLTISTSGPVNVNCPPCI